MLAVWLILARLARLGLAAPDGRPIVEFGRWGFAGLCLYLALLYGVTYVYLRPEALPFARVQLLTFVFYSLVLVGLWRHRRREPLPFDAVAVDARERTTVLQWFALVFGLGFLVSLLPPGPIVYLPFLVNNAAWSVAGFLLTGIALWAGTNESRNPISSPPSG